MHSLHMCRGYGTWKANRAMDIGGWNETYLNSPSLNDEDSPSSRDLCQPIVSPFPFLSPI